MPTAPRLIAGRARRAMAALATAGTAAVVLGHAPAPAPATPRPAVPSAPLTAPVSRDATALDAARTRRRLDPPDRPPAEASLRLDPRRVVAGGDIPAHFVGFSFEWTLVERYMGPNSRRAFANLLRNLGTGVLRIGGSSQDLLPFDPAASNTNRVITPEDLAAIRATLDAVNANDAPGGAPSWGVILGTAMAPRTAARPWVGPGHTRRFIEHGVEPAFSGAGRDIAGIELGNEVDVSYRASAGRYLRDFAAFSPAAAPFPIVGPSTSEVITPWTSIDARSVSTRFFWKWPALLHSLARAVKAGAGAFGSLATDHFYPIARGCSRDAYRCATVARLLSDERMANFRYQAYTHAREAARHGLQYRVAELNSAANRGVHGVSDVAASALWALDTMFNAACPRPHDAPAANGECRTAAIGVNFHNAEVRAFSIPGQGNAYYNAIDYDQTSAIGAPTAAPEYYALLLFARFAQGTHGLRPVAVPLRGPHAPDLKAWRVDAEGARRRLFLINKGDRPVTLTVAAAGTSYQVDRMTPRDPTGAGRTLDAPQMRIDGREVSADGTWPGFQPAVGDIAGGRFHVTVGAAEAAVITLHGQED